MRDNSSRFEAPEEEPAQEKVEAQPSITDFMSFAAPTQFVDLPSRGKHYAPNHPLHGQESVEIKFMTAKEEDILASQELIKKGVVLDRLIQSLLINKRISPDDMLLGDKTAIMYAARISAYGPEYNTKFFCRSCNEIVGHEFDLSELAIEDEPDLEDLEVEEEDGIYTCTLPSTGVKVGLRLLTGRDEKEIEKLAKKKSKTGLGPLTTQMLQIVHSINGVTAKAQIYHFIQNMPLRDSKYLRKVHAKVSPSMKTEYDITCGNCGAEQGVELPMTVEFFWPKQ